MSDVGAELAGSGFADATVGQVADMTEQRWRQLVADTTVANPCAPPTLSVEHYRRHPLAWHRRCAMPSLSWSARLWTAPPLVAIYYAFWPVIWLLNNSSHLTLRLLGLGQTDHAELAHTEEELRHIVAESVAGGHLSAPMVDVATTFKRHHADHAHAIGGLAGKAARSAVNATVNKSFSGRALRSGTEAEALGVAFELENAVAATYAYMISVIRGTNPAAVLSSIQSIEARHAVFLGTVIGKSLDDYALMFEPNELRSALDPAKNPIEG
jgi:hypothetical protein